MGINKRKHPQQTPELDPLPPPVYPMNWLLAATDQAWMRLSYGLRCANCEEEIIITGNTTDEAWAEIHKQLNGWLVLWTEDGAQLFCPKCGAIYVTAGFTVYQHFRRFQDDGLAQT